jgi:hypothetical protein
MIMQSDQASHSPGPSRRLARGGRAPAHGEPFEQLFPRGFVALRVVHLLNGATTRDDIAASRRRASRSS